MTRVSVIMPVYNAENTLRKSLKSIAAQTWKNIELVAVIDCSTDASLSILEDFKRTSGIDCTIISHEENMGVAVARNTGLDNATGDYICYVDADDTVAPDMIESFLAEGENADIIGADWFLKFDKNARYMRQGDYDSPLQALKNLMGGRMRWNLWMFMVKRSLYEGLRFFPGMNVGEDMYMTCCLFCRASKVKQIHKAYYNYNAVSDSSISRQFTERKRMEISYNLESFLSVLEKSEYKEALSDSILYLKLFLKQPLLMTSDSSSYEVWRDWMPESNCVEGINGQLPVYTRVVQWLAIHHCWIGVRLYYIIVYKFIYGLIYK